MPKILLIEDDPHMRLIVRDHLENRGHEVLLAQDGAFGLSISALEKPDLILLDIMMPVMDGVEALQTMREDPAMKDIPVIVMTAVTDPDMEDTARRMGVAAYLVKPVDMDELQTCIQGTLTFQPRKS